MGTRCLRPGGDHGHGVVQGIIGYVQYFNGIPAGLVAVHILGATRFMIVLTVLWWSLGRAASEIPTESDQVMVDNRETVAR